MLEKLKEDADSINLGIKKLRQSMHFLVNDYDYHHDNNENKVLANKKAILDQAEHSCVELKRSFQEIVDLMEIAKDKTEFYEDEIRRIADVHKIDLSAVLPNEKAVEIEPDPSENKENIAVARLKVPKRGTSL